jgi:DNA-binding MarR family transcriptional regulator
VSGFVSRAGPRRRAEARAGFATATNPALLFDGSGAAFRQFLADMLTLSVRMAAVRDRLAARVGLTGPQYQMLMTIAQCGEGGIAVRAVADSLHVSGAFVTSEVGKLVAAGLVAKSPNLADRRGVLLGLTRKGEAAVAELLPLMRGVNDAFFGALKAGEFERLAAAVSRLVEGSGDALLLAADFAGDRKAA